jgi:hypothetical protein
VSTQRAAQYSAQHAPQARACHQQSERR